MVKMSGKENAGCGFDDTFGKYENEKVFSYLKFAEICGASNVLLKYSG